MDQIFPDESSKSSRDSIKDFGTSQISLKSTKSLDKSSTSGGSFKHEKNSTHFKSDLNHDNDNQKTQSDAPHKVPHKIIANWRSACDKTKDKTKDLLKRWRTLPEFEAEHADKTEDESPEKSTNHQESCGWSVHVWTTWVDRFSVDSGENPDNSNSYQLSTIQNNKFSHFFSCLLDHDHDNLINEQDFETLIERLRHFADWSINSSEFNILREIQRGFVETFLYNISDEKLGTVSTQKWVYKTYPTIFSIGFKVNDIWYTSEDGWLHKWSELLMGSKNLTDFPIWLQFFVKVLFQVINRSGTGVISRDELSSFYSSVLGLDAVKVGEILDLAYQAMTSNGDHPLHYKSYRLCFSNYLISRNPNGPGHHILGAPPSCMSSIMFPIDYSALNAQPEDLEQYAPDQKSNRRSVIV